MEKSPIHKAIVTGPTGAVGVALIEELVSCGIEVVAVSRPRSARIASIPLSSQVSIVECDISELRLLPGLVEGQSWDAFFHFAWDGTYGSARQDWALQESNVRYCLDAVDAASRLGCKVFVGAGSQSEYGHVEGVLHPDAPCFPDNGYGAAKLAASHMSRSYCRALGIRHEWCRILSLYGAGDGDYTMVSQVIAKLLSRQRVSCTKGDQVWDYIYSKDAARAFRLVAERGNDGSVYNLGTAKPRLLKDFIAAIRDAIDPSVEIGFGELDYYPNQVMRLEADIDNLVRDTGFLPKYSFEQGIRETIELFKIQHPYVAKKERK